MKWPILWPLGFVLILPLCLVLTSSCVPVENAIRRNVVVDARDWLGSGVIVKTDHVLTNLHIVKTAKILTVNSFKCVILATDEKHDLALLKTSTPSFRQVSWNYPYVGQAVFYVGNPQRHINTVSKGFVVYKDFEETVTNTLPVGGMSGGGLYNYWGQLVGLNVGMEGDGGGLHMAVHIPIEVVNKFLKENLR